VGLKIQEYELRKQIDSEKEFSLLLKRKMEKFIEAFRDEMAGISAEDFEREAEGIEEGETPLNVYGSLKEFRWATIMKKCGRFFKEFELKLARRFIEENRAPPRCIVRADSAAHLGYLSCRNGIRRSHPKDDPKITGVFRILAP